MKKETIIAIIFGIIFGALVALFLLAKNKEFQLTKTKTIGPTKKTSKIVKNIKANQRSLEILEPQDGSIFEAKTVTVKGKAAKDSLIVIQSPVKETVIKNDKEEFTASFPLALGDNVIKITVHLKDNQSRPQEKELHIYNLDEEL